MSFRHLRTVLAVVAVAVAAWATPASALTPVQQVKSASGIEAWLIEDHAVPVISLQFMFKGGAALDPPAKSGVANLAVSTLDEGAGELDAEAFRKRLADLSIGFSAQAGRDEVIGTLSTLTENSDAAFRLLALALTKPRFDKDAVERVRDGVRRILAQQATNPNAVAGRAWYESIFAGHPYARATQGTEATLAALTPDDLRGFVAYMFRRGNLIVGVAGDVTPADLARLLDLAFGALPAGAPPDPVRDTAPGAPGLVRVIERPVPQSVVIFGQKGPLRTDPDWFAATVVNYVLGGGGFSSRLTASVREAGGLAYSISTGLRPQTHAGMLIGQVATRNEKVGDAIALIRQEWKKLAEEGLTEQELADAKTYLTGSFPLSLDSTSRLADVLVQMQQYGLGIDYLERRKGLIDKVTIEDAKRVARSMLDPAALSMVVVGRPVGVVPVAAVGPAPASPGTQPPATQLPGRK